MNHFITLARAVEMTTLYREQMETVLSEQYRAKNLLVRSETFDRAAIDALLASPDCQKLRVYYGMSEDFQVHAILVGVNSSNGDILPKSITLSGAEEPIVEVGVRCPPDCPPLSELNL